MQKLLVINAGSSSMKFKVYEKTDLKPLAEGVAERIFIDGNISIETHHGKKETLKVNLDNHLDAIQEMIKLLQKYKVINNLEEIKGIGHRVVQGGEQFKESVLIGDEEIKLIDKCSKLAPLHNPSELDVIKAFIKLAPLSKNVAVFDTSFHQTMPKEIYMYGLPRDWYVNHGVRKYGMHGTSHKYITLEMQKILKKEKVNIISAHLGNGASITAIKESQSYNTSMGLTPLSGIVMGTRSGDIDPAIIEYMCKETNKSVEEITNSLNKKSGVLGLSGISSDFRDIVVAFKNGNKNAEETLEIYSKRVADVISQYQNDLENKVDALVFTAGVGENSVEVRAKIMQKLHTLNTDFDFQKNKIHSNKSHVELSKPNSKVKVYIVKTNEELMIVKDLILKANL